MNLPFDRRQHMRAGATDFLLTIDSGDTVEVKDVSQAGVCCVVEDPVAEMTEVKLNLQIPQTGDAKPVKFTCHGAVVRCERQKDHRYELAIFFLSIDEYYRDLIQAHVEAQNRPVQP